MKRIGNILSGIFLLGLPYWGQSQSESLPFGDFENWTVRLIKESSIVGGNEVAVYAIGPGKTIKGNIPYKSEVSPWASSNVYAEVFGVVKANVNVWPQTYESGICAVLRTEQVSFRVAGMMRVSLLTAGAIYLGKVHEPVKNTDEAYACVDMGIPFTRKPDYLMFDYAATIGNSGKLLYLSTSRKKEYAGYDKAQVLVQLQRRWEENGHVYARRVATGEFLIGKTTDWRKDFRLALHYGKPANESTLSENGRLNSIFYTVNRQGKSVPIQEVGWAALGTEPTHLIIFISSGSQGPYRGEPGNELRIDNLRLGYGKD